MFFEDLPQESRMALMQIGEDYVNNLRYPGGSMPSEAAAGTTAEIEQASSVRDNTIREVATEILLKAMAQKQRIEAKAMPKDQPVPPKSRPVEQRAREAEEKAKFKPPPQKLVGQLQQ